MYHGYVAACTEDQYKKYGQLDETLLLREIISLGIHIPGGFRAEDGKIYSHMLAVMSDAQLNDLHELFPDVTTQWTHYERSRSEESSLRARMPKFRVTREKGAVRVDTQRATFRI